jgi:hypothetical protein
MTSRVQHSANCWIGTKPISQWTVTHIRRSPRATSTRRASDLSRSTGVLAVVSRAAAGNPSRCPKRISTLQPESCASWSGLSDYALIRVPGLFASRETFVPSRFAAATSGCGSGSARTKSSTADFRANSSRVERSDLRDVIPIFGHIFPVEHVGQKGPRCLCVV